MHDCHQILAEVHGTRGDLTDQPLPDAEATWYTDGSSFLRNEAVRTPGQLSLEYSDSDLDIVQQIGAKYDEQMKVWKHQGKTVLPQKRAKELVTHLHRWTHLGHKKLKALLRREGWTEAFPTKRETAQVVVKKILEEIFPRFGLPKVIGSDNGPAFISQDRLKALQIIQHQIWKPLAAVYRPGDTTGPHPFQIGDSVYVRRHQSRTLEPRWKGPYTVLLTTPTALKVDGIAAWVHASHVQRAPSTSTADASQDRPDEPLQWKLHRTQNPLKIRLSKIVQ
uniref:uncharacterized protein LOC129493727 n=1 Tax=Nyctereutes procyonoides TaxID=34880 RepID=UPI002444B227|nr:uncharacterized protein LOC129493727 [Nyctereutes procyonoides]